MYSRTGLLTSFMEELMRTKSLVLALFMATCLQGCKTVDNVSDEKLAKGIGVVSKGAAQYGLGYVLKKNPDKALAIADGARIAVEVLRETILPAFTGAETEGVLRSAVDTALQELSDKLDPSMMLAVQLAIDIISTRIQLPENPLDKIDERTRLAIVAAVRGLADGFEAGGAAAPPTTRETAPAALSWPKP